MRTVGDVSVTAEYGAVRLLVADEESDGAVATLLDVEAATQLISAIQAEIRDARNAAVS